MGIVGPHKHSKGAQNLSGQVHFLLLSPLLTELSMPLSDQKASSFMSGILNASIIFYAWLQKEVRKLTAKCTKFTKFSF